MLITIRRGSFLNEPVNALVIPTNSTGALLGELLDEVKAVAGEEVEEAAIAEAPIHIGEAIATIGGLLRCKIIIHAPIAEFPEGKSDEHAVKCALEAALELAEENKFSRIALPLRWTIPPALAAQTILASLIDHKSNSLTEVILEDREEVLVAAWQVVRKMVQEKQDDKHDA